MSVNYLTSEDIKEKKERLTKLENELIVDARERLETARSYGDLSENAEYDIAKEDVAKFSSEIAELQLQLSTAKVIEDKKHVVAEIGATVSVKNVKTGIAYEYKIVGAVGADPMNKKQLSNESPLGVALDGKKAGDKIVVDAPKGKIEYEIIKVK